MKIAVIGGGPAGLYFSYLMKRDDPALDIKVIEQNPRDATFGFGVVFSDRALEFLLEVGVIHRLESRNAFICCVHPGHERGAHFLICRDCDRVAELDSPDSGLLDEADSLGFAVDHSVIEITGVCADCQKNAD